MGRMRPLPPLVSDEQMSPEALKLKRFHDDFLMKHSSPAREKFIYEFGRKSLPSSWLPTEQPPRQQLVASPPLSSVKRNLNLETSNQFQYMSYEDALKIPSFQPEVKHRYVKSES